MDIFFPGRCTPFFPNELSYLLLNNYDKKMVFICSFLSRRGTHREKVIISQITPLYLIFKHYLFIWWQTGSEGGGVLSATTPLLLFDRTMTAALTHFSWPFRPKVIAIEFFLVSTGWHILPYIWRYRSLGAKGAGCSAYVNIPISYYYWFI